MALEFSDLKGLTLTNVRKLGDDQLVFDVDDGRQFQLIHFQDCCESVTIDDINGDLQDLVGTPILLAEEAVNDNYDDGRSYDSCTWTFYKLATIKGSVDIRWFGESNGYYSESVSFIEAKPKDQTTWGYGLRV